MVTRHPTGVRARRRHPSDTVGNICSMSPPTAHDAASANHDPTGGAPARLHKDGYALAYEEARRALEDQEGTVTELRARAGTLIAGAAIATSFFGGQTLTGPRIVASGWIAIACFVLLGFVVLIVLWPRHDWEFSLAPDRFIATYLEPANGDPLDIHLIQRDLALHMGRSAELNRRQLRILMIAFRLGALLLVAEVLAWVVALYTRLK